MDNLYQKGIYVGCKVVGESIGRIGELCSKLNLPLVDDPHATIIYSRKAPNSDDISSVNPIATISNIRSWQGHDKQYYVVAGLESRDLHTLHAKWIKRGCEHSFPTFEPHITLGKFATADEVPNFEKLNQQLQTDPINIYFAPEYTEELDMDSESSVIPTRSLAKTCADFFMYNRGAVNATHSAEAADMRYPALVRRLQKFLQEEGYDNAKLIVFRGLRHPTVHPCKRLIGVQPDNVEHAVVQVGNLCIDPCRLRLGSDYYEFNNYPYAQAMKEQWKHLVDVTHLTKLTPEDIRHRQKMMQAGHLNGGNEEAEDEREDLMDDVISSDSQFAGFSEVALSSKAKINHDDLMLAFKYRMFMSNSQTSGNLKLESFVIDKLYCHSKADTVEVLQTLADSSRQYLFKPASISSLSNGASSISGSATLSFKVAVQKALAHAKERGLERIAIMFSHPLNQASLSSINEESEVVINSNIPTFGVMLLKSAEV